MSSAIITEFIFDDQNDEEFADHGLSSRQVFQLLDNKRIVIPNPRPDIHRASHLFIGQDNGGAVIMAPIELVHEPDVWRPVTAWLAPQWAIDQLTERGK